MKRDRSKWNQSEKGKAAQQRYRQSEKGKATAKKYAKRRHPHEVGYNGSRSIYCRLLKIDQQILGDD